jgi:hypothetical protein
MGRTIQATNITADTIKANKFIGLTDDLGTTSDIKISASLDVTDTGITLADQDFEDVDSLSLSPGKQNEFISVSFEIRSGDIILVKNKRNGETEEDIVLDTSNQLSEVTKCDHLLINPSYSKDENDENEITEKIALQIISNENVNSDIVAIHKNSNSEDNIVFKISSLGQTTITDITVSTSLKVTGSNGIILKHNETITNPTGGTVLINGIVSSGTGSAPGVFQSNGDYDLTLKTGNDTTGSITITNGDNGNIAITPNGTGEVDISKVDIDSGTIDNTVIGGTTPANASFNQLFIKSKIITTANLTSQSNLLDSNYPNSVFYFNLDNGLENTASITATPTDGQVIHMFYDNAQSGGSLKIYFGSNNLRCGSGEAQYLTFNSKGQSASLVFIGNSIDKWCILNTGAVIS